MSQALNQAVFFSLGHIGRHKRCQPVCSTDHPPSFTSRHDPQKVKVRGHSVQKLERKRADGQTDGRLHYLQCYSAVGSKSSLLHCVSKNCTPKAGRHKFIKISSPVMIFHTMHRHSVVDRLSSKSLVRVEYQLQGFYGNQAPNNRMLFITERIRRRRRLIYCL